MLKFLPMLRANRAPPTVAVGASQCAGDDVLAGSLDTFGFPDSALLDTHTTIHRVQGDTFPEFGVLIGGYLDGVASFRAVGGAWGCLFLGLAVLAGEVVHAEETNPAFARLERQLTKPLGSLAVVRDVVPVHFDTHLDQAEAQVAHPLEPAVVVGEVVMPWVRVRVTLFQIDVEQAPGLRDDVLDVGSHVVQGGVHFVVKNR